MFTWKLGPHLSETKVSDFKFPLECDLNYSNHIIGFVQKPNRWNGCNVIMSNGVQSKLPLNEDGGKNYFEVRIHPAGSIVKKVIMRGNYEFAGC